jgi:hypothetical protein
VTIESSSPEEQAAAPQIDIARYKKLIKYLKST